MATTSNFGWTTPDDTDLVKDGAAAIRTLGSAIDTSLVDLKGGTTGQVLSKTSNTDMDFTWVAQDDTDAIQSSIIAAKGDLIVGTANDTAGILSVGTDGYTLVADSSVSPQGLKWAVDPVADVVTTAGDLLYATAADTVTRLGIGTAGQVLQVNAGATAPEWATPAGGGGGKVLQVVSAVTTTSTAITTQSMSDTGITATITPTLATSKVLVIISAQSKALRSTGDIVTGARLLRGATTIADYNSTNRTGYVVLEATGATAVGLTNVNSVVYLDSPATTSATTYKLQAGVESNSDSGTINFQRNNGASTITLLEIGV